MKTIERNKLQKNRIKELESLLKKLRIDLRALRNRLDDSTDKTLISSRVDMITYILKGKNICKSCGVKFQPLSYNYDEHLKLKQEKLSKVGIKGNPIAKGKNKEKSK